MWIKKIHLKKYRNYDNIEVEFNKKLNIIIGNNAQGKTNLLESIYVLAVTKSFLSVNDKSLIMFNNKFSLLTGDVIINNKKKQMEVIISEDGKNVRINKKEIRKLSDYVSNLNVVIFSADDIRVFKDSPSVRRKYFNVQISQVRKEYLKILSDYNLILKQRNEFLKIININNQNDLYYLDILNDKYADLSIKLFDYRENYIDNLNNYIDDIFKSITGISGLKLNYLSNLSSFENKENYLNKLQSTLEKDILYKKTLIGPNRDDYYFSLNNKNIAIYGSQGQIRSSVLALKLAEVILFTEITGESPVLLLDDIFSELDIRKRNSILNYLNDSVQTIITTTDIENISVEIRKKANVYKIKEGKIISREIIFEQEGDDINE